MASRLKRNEDIYLILYLVNIPRTDHCVDCTRTIRIEKKANNQNRLLPCRSDALLSSS